MADKFEIVLIVELDTFQAKMRITIATHKPTATLFKYSFKF